jgi:hypothetical protein
MKYLCHAVGLFVFMAAAQGKEISSPPITLPLWTMVLFSKDWPSPGALPYRFRSTWDTIPDTFNTTGLTDLKMSGSAQFSASQFKAYVAYMGNLGVSPDQIVVLDLREEPHAFLNGHAFMWNAKGAWWTQGNPVSLVVSMEKERLAALSVGQKVTLKRIDKKNNAGYFESVSDQSFTIESLQTEEEVVQGEGAHYVRLPVTDHMRPEDKDVDQFLGLVKQLSSNASLYFHCHGGRGRTSTFMILYDIIRNPKLSLKTIMDRSRDVRVLSSSLKVRKHPNEKYRLKFINLFYQYVNDPKGYGTTSWTKWVTQRTLKLSGQYDENNAFTSTEVASAAGPQSE